MNELITKNDLVLALDDLTSKLTIRLGSMIVAGMAALAGLQCFH